MMRRINPKAKRQAVLRILSSRTTMEDEAKRLGVTRQAVSGWVKDARQALHVPTGPDDRRAAPRPAPTPGGEQTMTPGGSAPPDAAAPSGDGAYAGPPSPDIFEILDAAGVPAPKVTGTPITPGEVKAAVQEARAEDVELVLDVVGGFKTTVGCAYAEIQLNLPEGDPEVLKAVQLGPIAKEALRMNATLLAPELRKHMGGWGAVALALGIDSLVSIKRLKAMAIRRGTLDVEEEKPEEPPAPAGPALPPGTSPQAAAN